MLQKMGKELVRESLRRSNGKAGKERRYTRKVKERSVGLVPVFD